MKRLKYNPKAMIATMTTVITLVTTGCGATISDKEELEQAIETLETAQDELKTENAILEALQTRLKDSVDDLKAQKESLKNEVAQLQSDKDALENRIDYLQNYEFDIDNLYVVNYSVLYGENDYYQAKPYYQIATRESMESIAEKCSYLPEGENNNTCYKSVYKTVESPGDFIFFSTHYIGNSDEGYQIFIEVLDNKKNANLNSIENKEQTYQILESFMVPLFQVIHQEDYGEILTREQLLEIVNKMNQGNYFDDRKQLITKRPQQ